MPLILERLLSLAAVLFTAVARRKKKFVRKKPKRAAKKSSRASRRKVRKARSPKSVKRSPASALAKKQAKSEPAHPVAEQAELLPEPTPPFGRPILLVPKDGTYADNIYPTFRWLSVGGATRYEVNWGEDSALASRHATVSLATEATVPVEKPLRPNGIYHWRVRGGNDAGWGPWSLVATFRVLEENV